MSVKKNIFSAAFLYTVFLMLYSGCAVIPNEDFVPETTASDDDEATDDGTSVDDEAEEEGDAADDDTGDADDETGDSVDTDGTDEEGDPVVGEEGEQEEEPVVPEDPHDRFLRGQDIFVNNCAVCHGSFNGQDPLNIPLYTSLRIQWGIDNADEMEDLDFLTAEEIETIIYALQVRYNVIEESDDIVVYNTPVP